MGGFLMFETLVGNPARIGVSNPGQSTIRLRRRCRAAAGDGMDGSALAARRARAAGLLKLTES